MRWLIRELSLGKFLCMFGLHSYVRMLPYTRDMACKRCYANK